MLVRRLRSALALGAEIRGMVGPHAPTCGGRGGGGGGGGGTAAAADSTGGGGVGENCEGGQSAGANGRGGGGGGMGEGSGADATMVSPANCRA